MKLIFDDVLEPELKDYLLSQEGITKVDITVKDFVSEMNIEFDKEITPLVVLKYIELFRNDKLPIMLSFDKDVDYQYNELKYLVDDMCCEYCYKSLVQELFNNKHIKSVKSNFDFHEPAFNIELIIEYDNGYSEEELKDFIKENI